MINEGGSQHKRCWNLTPTTPSKNLQTEGSSRMPIYEVTPGGFRRVEGTSFVQEKVRERADLQRLLRSEIGVIAPDAMVIAEEFGDWEDSKRRVDLLALDKNANLVVIELKRTEDAGHAELQAVRYAAMLSTMTFDQVVDAHANLLRKPREEAERNILTFLGWEDTKEEAFGQDLRIIIVSAEFSKELTTSVMWLNDHGIDIRCIRLKPYRLDSRLLVDVQQIIPLPEAAEYQVQLRKKEQEERKTRAERHDLREGFWRSLLDRARPKTPLHVNISPSTTTWISATAGMRGLGLNYVVLQHESRVELYISRGPAEESKAVFDALAEEKESIEKAFGERLGWERLDEKGACRIKKDITLGGYRDQERWPSIQDAMIDAMIRLDKALAPHIAKLKTRSAMN